MLVSVAGFAQTKEELREARKAERAEQRRIRDSMYNMYLAEQEKAYQEEQERLEAVRAKEGSTSLLVVTHLEEPKQVLDYLVHSLISNGYTPASIDKDYYIVKTAPKMIGSATYETTYTLFLNSGKVCVRAASVAHGSISVGYGLIRSNTEIVTPVEYKANAAKGSLVETAWREMEAFLLALPYSNVEYIKGE